MLESRLFRMEKPHAADIRGPKRVLFPVLAAVLSIAVVWGIPEIVVRLVSPKLDRYTAILFGNDPMSPELFMRDARLGWKLRPGADVRFLGVRVRTNSLGFRGSEPAPDGRTILCLGDSITFGWRVEEQAAFPARLEGLLREGDAGTRPWVVVNAGVPGYSSFQVRRLAETLIPRLRPEIVVVSAGTNDDFPSSESDGSYFRRTRFSAALDSIASRSRFFVWLRNRLVPEPTSVPVSDILAPGMKPRVSRDEMLDNIRAVVNEARAAGADPIILASPANLYEHPVRKELTPDQHRRLERNEAILALAASGRADAALARADLLLRENPSDFQALWLRGIALLNLGRFDEGRRALADAFDAHPAPAGVRPSWKKELRRMAAREEVTYLDADAAIELAVGRERPADLYLDSCHPTPFGHARIASALAAVVSSR